MESATGFVAAGSSRLVFAQAARSIRLSPCHDAFPKNREAAYDEVRATPAMGRIVVAPDGNFSSYEWLRPYGWVPNCSGVAFAVAPRMQTFMSNVNTPAGPRTCEQRSSQYQFYPTPGATYWLGELSPDAEELSFYELDRDDKKVRAAVVWNVASGRREIPGLDMPPDDARLHKHAIWVSENELVYPVKGVDTDLAGDNVTAVPPIVWASRTSASKAALAPCDTHQTADSAEGPMTAAPSADGKLVFHAIDTTELIKLLRDLVSLGKLFLLYKIIRQRPQEQPEKRRSRAQ